MGLRFLLFFSLLFLAACGGPDSSDAPVHPERIRIASFNIAMGMEAAGQLGRALESGDDERLTAVARILQQLRPDIVLLNEFDYDPQVDAAMLFNENYLSRAGQGQQAIRYPWSFRASVNTGIDSGLDLDGDGETGGPGDAWGFGHFPGQYGMMVLSRFPLQQDKVRTFQYLRWSDMPGAARPLNPNGSSFYSDAAWEALRLSSKSHWDLAFDIDGATLHLLAHHPTPPVFDGPEDRNGRRNHDEIRLWADYSRRGDAGYIVDDDGQRGGLPAREPFVIAGDFNADPNDGDASPNAIRQLLEADWIDASCVPMSAGGAAAAVAQGGVNQHQRGEPGADTADFNDRHTGNLRLDYVLPSRGLKISGCGVFWPAVGEPGRDWAEASDHRLVWLDIVL